jgi:2-methylisocitrate lyase-like PEP mutase family enzyme
MYKNVCAFLDVGVSGINIEDQILPSPKVGGVIDPVLMVEKIQAAREAARNRQAADMVINAHPGAFAACDDRVKGIDEAIIRRKKYLQAGADLIFVTAISKYDLNSMLTMQYLRVPLSHTFFGTWRDVRIAAGIAFAMSEIPTKSGII